MYGVEVGNTSLFNVILIVPNYCENYIKFLPWTQSCVRKDRKMFDSMPRTSKVFS